MFIIITIVIIIICDLSIDDYLQDREQIEHRERDGTELCCVHTGAVGAKGFRRFSPTVCVSFCSCSLCAFLPQKEKPPSTSDDWRWKGLRVHFVSAPPRYTQSKFPRGEELRWGPPGKLLEKTYKWYLKYIRENIFFWDISIECTQRLILPFLDIITILILKYKLRLKVVLPLQQ